MLISVLLVTFSAGYFVFVFLTESLNPFSKIPRNRSRKRWRFARSLGLIVAASGFLSLLSDGSSLAGMLQYSLLAMLPMLAILIAYSLLTRANSRNKGDQNTYEKDDRLDSSNSSRAAFINENQAVGNVIKPGSSSVRPENGLDNPPIRIAAEPEELALSGRLNEKYFRRRLKHRIARAPESGGDS